MTAVRCPWAEKHPLDREYHDTEWGVPVGDDQKMFEFLILESAQAGLSWHTILKRRQNYSQAFAEFNADAVARFDENRISELMQDAGIIRNLKKIQSAIGNARAFLEIRSQHGSFRNYIWDFVDGTPIQNQWTSQDQVPATTPLAQTIAKDLKKRGFTFLGPTTVYAFMQATGLVNDHVTTCYRHEEIRALSPMV